MAIAQALQRYLDQNVTYRVIPHEPTMSSMRTAQICQISGDCLAKGGDHATLVHMSHAQFAQLTAEARHGCFSAHD